MQTDSTRSPFWIPNETIPVRDLSNQEFLERFARSGRVGLSNGPLTSEARAQRGSAAGGGLWGPWTHAFVFEGTRVDGNHWVVESSLAVEEKNPLVEVRERRIDYYFDPRKFPALAVLDFGLSQEHTLRLVRHALDLVATEAVFSTRELVTFFSALKNPALRGKESALAQDRSFLCSALIGMLFRKIGMDIVPGLTSKHTSPDELTRSVAPHQTYLLQRGPAPARVNGARKKPAATPAKPAPVTHPALRRATTLKGAVR